MSGEHIGVAISTTGHEHRMDLLFNCVLGWTEALPEDASLFVTVDGTEADAQRVADRLIALTHSVFRVGRPLVNEPLHGHRLGVAANKNTGIELLMDRHPRGGWPGIEELWLSDDDTWPLHPESLALHSSLHVFHSMLGWGSHRRPALVNGLASWSWPRGSVLYTRRSVIVAIGGMNERFGLGGHEHVEWSRRIHQAGFTPAPYVSPSLYMGEDCMGAAQFWHAEDMPKPGEPVGDLRLRRRHLTSLSRGNRDDARNAMLMRRLDGDTSFQAFRSASRGRGSATLYQHA